MHHAPHVHVSVFSLSRPPTRRYEIAPPPESIWASDAGDDDDMDEFTSELDDFFNMDFEEEDAQGNLSQNPMMPWYEQVDAW